MAKKATAEAVEVHQFKKKTLNQCLNLKIELIILLQENHL
jgi:hypothetical protein